jgi:hypothetical protein
MNPLPQRIGSGMKTPDGILIYQKFLNAGRMVVFDDWYPEFNSIDSLHRTTSQYY